MTRINRRDYLKRMSSGAVALATTRFPFFDDKEEPASYAASQPSVSRLANQRLTNDQAWPPVYDVNDKAMFTLILGGLMGFFYNPANGKCEIGFHPGDGMHKPQLQIQEKIDGKCRELFGAGPLSGEIQRIAVDVVDGTGAIKGTNVKFFKTRSTFNRYDRTEPKDFRWLLDLAGDDFYPENYRPKKKFNRALVVSQGKFYTRTITNSTFYRVDNHGGTKQMGYMPMLMAAEVLVGPDEYVLLQLQTLKSNQPVTLSEFKLYPKDKSIFELQFLNGCAKEDCDWQYDSDNEERRNDFHYMRKVLDLPLLKIKYGIKIEKKADFGAEEDRCPEIHFKNTDEAPCMGGGYGGGGLPFP